MKRFLLFAGDWYYPMGGMRDLIASFSSIEEAVENFNKLQEGKPAVNELDSYDCGSPTDYDWAHIFDFKEGKEVWTYNQK